MGISTGLNKSLIEYKLVFHGIIVQHIDDGSLNLVAPGDKIVIQEKSSDYCRWHDGPLDKKDNPFDRNYCLRKISSKIGYCDAHIDSHRALYNKCLTSAGYTSLYACRLLDALYNDKIEYTIYILDYGHGLKVGVTRSWRFLERISEQPHVIATKIYETKSSLKAREIELKISRIKEFTERPKKRSLKNVLSYPPKLSYRKLYSSLNRLQKENIGIHIDLEDIAFIRILPSIDITYYVKAVETSLDKIKEEVLEIIDYWMGYILLNRINTNEYFIVHSKNLLHKNSIRVPR